MKVFISWSGERSQALAVALREWLPLVLHYIEPWVSQSDIEAGERWALEVAKELEASNFGVICVTKDNIGSEWLLFEAGALSRSMQEGRVIPLLFDLEFKDITGPIAQFQAKKFESSGIWDLVSAINRSVDLAVPEARLKQLFEALWPELEKKVGDIPATSGVKKVTRPQQEVLEELVQSVRGLDSRLRDVAEDSPRMRRKRGRFHPMMVEEMSHMLELGRSDPLRILIVGSLAKDEFPWLYELAVDAYRDSRSGKTARSRDAKKRFLAGIRATRHMSAHDSDRELSYMLRELESILEEDLDRFGNQELEARAAQETRSAEGSLMELRRRNATANGLEPTK
jgi:hypothetical protein